MPRTAKEAKEAQRRCAMAWAVSRAMSRDVPVILSDHSGTLIAEGRIVRRERSETFGIVVYTDDPAVTDSIPLPFIKKMALSERS